MIAAVAELDVSALSVNRRGNGSPQDLPRMMLAVRYLTDSDSRVMRKSRYDSYTQAFNAQATFDADGTQLTVAASVIQTPSDTGALVPAVDEIESTLRSVNTVADTGYRNIEAIERLESGGIDVYVATGAGDHNCRR